MFKVKANNNYPLAHSENADFLNFGENPFHFPSSTPAVSRKLLLIVRTSIPYFFLFIFLQF